MEADWDEVQLRGLSFVITRDRASWLFSEVVQQSPNVKQIAAISLATSAPTAIPPQVTALAFDTLQELLWTGSEHVSMFYMSYAGRSKISRTDSNGFT